MAKPIVFVGSSMEGIPIAERMGEKLKELAVVRLWNTGVFRLGDTAIETLLDQLNHCSFGVFVLTPDDWRESRQTVARIPRDNVIFEAGLFMGRLGRRRAFLVRPRNGDLRLPSDLSGVTCAVYEPGQPPDLSQAASQIQRELSSRRSVDDLQIVRTVLDLVPHNKPLTTTCFDIVSDNLFQLWAGLVRLESLENWPTLVALKTRLSEFFEFSGRYRDGVQFALRYLDAIHPSGDMEEVLWTRIKNIGYLRILADQHVQGREEIETALEELPSHRNIAAPRAAELLFYGHRYLGISFQRDDIAGDLDEAYNRFRAAESFVERADSPKRRRTLKARIIRNLGNLALHKGKPKEAREHFSQSLGLFQELGDVEHIGVTQLKIGETYTAGKRKHVEKANAFLERAQRAFTKLGSIEYQARAEEQYAKMFEQLNNPETALRHAKQSKLLFERIDNRKGAGRVGSLIERLRRKHQIDE